MLRIDKAILDTNGVICENISQLSSTDRGLLSQNILGQIRNFVEYIAVKIYGKGKDVDPNNYDLRQNALDDMRSKGHLRFIYSFHKMLQASVSHYTFDKDGSERLMLKYYEHLLKIKIYLKNTFGMDVLMNIKDFPLNTDSELSEYYEKIAVRIEMSSISEKRIQYNDRYYVQKVKPFFVNQKIYYEVTLTAANNKASKFDRCIVFTQHEIVDNYAIKCSMHSDIIDVLGKKMPILVIDTYEVSIRRCEWENFSKIFGSRMVCSTKSIEYRRLMEYLTQVGISLTELVSSEQQYYDDIKRRITEGSKSVMIYGILDQCREIIISNKPGANVLRYLLFNMNNRIIKSQYDEFKCNSLSDLYLKYGCIPFDKMPYCTSLPQHNPRLFDLFESIPVSNREHELFARYITNNTEIEGHLFTPKTEIKGFKDIDSLIQKYNATLYYKHEGRRIEEFKNHIYVKSYADDCAIIIRKLQELASSGISQYTPSVDSWMSNESYTIDDDSKKEALRHMFSDSRVALIYGAAGTGKSTLIKHVSNFFADKDKIFLANTHPAVDNMRRKVTTGNSSYYTIAKFLSKGNNNIDCDILFIDECSTVSNIDMQSILEKAKFKLLVLVGDIYQIESIYFGNWFTIAKEFLRKSATIELTHPYRTNNEELLKVWKSVREFGNTVLEPLVSNGYVARLDGSIFERDGEDEIILCLNYDGLYGINNINRFLQNSNPNEKYNLGINSYKVDDPILFNESNIFSPLIHNNSKGRIVGIHPEEERIWFDIELDKAINEIDANRYDFKLIGESVSGNSIISFSVNKFRNSDEGDDSNVVPFQVAYAVSIHKAQGLEYNSVKIVITNETEERITHNIFYTAITRTKNKLKIYWSPETEKAVLDRFVQKKYTKDEGLLSALHSLEMAKSKKAR